MKIVKDLTCCRRAANWASACASPLPGLFLPLGSGCVSELDHTQLGASPLAHWWTRPGWVPRLRRRHSHADAHTLFLLLRTMTESRVSGDGLTLELFCRQILFSWFPRCKLSGLQHPPTPTPRVFSHSSLHTSAQSSLVKLAEAFLFLSWSNGLICWFQDTFWFAQFWKCCKSYSSVYNLL